MNSAIRAPMTAPAWSRTQATPTGAGLLQSLSIAGLPAVRLPDAGTIVSNVLSRGSLTGRLLASAILLSAASGPALAHSPEGPPLPKDYHAAEPGVGFENPDDRVDDYYAQTVGRAEGYHPEVIKSAAALEIQMRRLMQGLFFEGEPFVPPWVAQAGRDPDFRQKVYLLLSHMGQRDPAWFDHEIDWMIGQYLEATGASEPHPPRHDDRRHDRDDHGGHDRHKPRSLSI